MGCHQVKALTLGQIELAARRLDEAEPRAQLAGPAGEAATLVEADAVILPRVRGVVEHAVHPLARVRALAGDRKSTRLNSSHGYISYAVFCLKKKKKSHKHTSFR